MDGILNVLKPPGMTSHDVINWTRRTLNTKKAGHTGTLDPGAAGVLPICIGKATKVIPYINEDRKIYRVKIVFGQTTDTQDQFGQVLKKTTPNFDLPKLNEALQVFTGKIQQKPSIYSAIKVNGKKLYEYARQGKIVEIPMRDITIFNIKILYLNIPQYAFLEVECSKGTYIRTLCADIGEYIGCGAHMGFLVRTKSGDFSISSSCTLEEIEKKYSTGLIGNLLLPLDFPLNSYPRIDIRESAKTSLINGNAIYPQGIQTDMQKHIEGSLVSAYIENTLTAMGKIESDIENNRYYFKPLRVLI